MAGDPIQQLAGFSVALSVRQLIVDATSSRDFQFQRSDWQWSALDHFLQVSLARPNLPVAGVRSSLVLVRGEPRLTVTRHYVGCDIAWRYVLSSRGMVSQLELIDYEAASDHDSMSEDGGDNDDGGTDGRRRGTVAGRRAERVSPRGRGRGGGRGVRAKATAKPKATATRVRR